MDWHAFLLGENNWAFLWNTALRTAFMFLVLVLMLRFLGKKGIQQLSIFELGVIIGLGSAAGDPMFYKDVGVIPSVIVFSIVVLMYRFISFLMDKNSKVQQILEGKPVYLIDEGKLLIRNFRREILAKEELFSILRQKQVSHLGQVFKGILESSGHVSIYFYPDEDVKYGLSILPLDNETDEAIPSKGIYACCNCGQTETLSPAPSNICKVCEGDEWTIAVKNIRIK